MTLQMLNCVIIKLRLCTASLNVKFADSIATDTNAVE